MKGVGGGHIKGVYLWGVAAQTTNSKIGRRDLPVDIFAEKKDWKIKYSKVGVGPNSPKWTKQAEN